MRAQKWFTGERWLTFCEGFRGSPGGPQAVAEVVKIIANDLETRGVTRGSATAAEEAAKQAEEQAKKAAKETGVGGAEGNKGGKGGKGGGGGESKGAFADRAAASRVAVAILAADAAPPQDAIEATIVQQVVHVPTQVERAADQVALAKIRARYGSRAQTLINALLAFDAYFAWWFPLKRSIPFMAPWEQRVQRAVDNSRLAIDMHEIFERVAIHNHGSFLPHAAIYKVSRDILRVGDVWAVGTSPLLEHTTERRN